MSPGSRIAVAMSGGVDSSVTAALLQQQGFEVIGISLRFWSCEDASNEPQKGCCGIDGLSYARATAGKLNISHYVMDCREAFEAKVLKPAWQEYARGRTPNPCVICNQDIKFKLLFQYAQKLGATRIATGHHAIIQHEDDLNGASLWRGKDHHKDQSYFLFSLSLEQLNHSMMPVGHLTKKEVRALAQGLELTNADRPESQDACLGIGEEGFAEALRKRFAMPQKEGPIVNQHGQQLATHQGIHRFTIGQRRGLGVAMGQRAYVLAIDADQDSVMIGNNLKLLEATGLFTSKVSWLVPMAPKGECAADVQIRYRHAPVKALITWNDQRTAVVRFDQPQRAVTPGQAAVFYQNRRVIGGGWIEKALQNETR